MSRKMIILNNTRKHNIHCVCAAKKVEARLMPGYNSVPETAWQHISKEQAVEDRIDMGWIEVVREDEEDIDISFYMGLHAAKARNVAKGLKDAEVLLEWAKEEKRETVKKAICKRVEELQGDDIS